MEKMVKLVEKSSKDIKIIEDMALNLGVSKKDFYLKLWNVSQKKISNIYQYLIPCHDIPSIKR